MTTVPQLRAAMDAIAKKKGDFSLFGLCMRDDSRGQWDLVVAAPWLEVGILKPLRELIRLLENQLGKREVRQFARIVTLEPGSPEMRTELAALNIDGDEKRFVHTTMFGAELEEAVILRAMPARVSSNVPRTTTLKRRSRQRRAGAKSKKRSAAARG